MTKKTWLKILGIGAIIAVLTGLALFVVLPVMGSTAPTITSDAATFVTKSGVVSAVFNGTCTVGSYRPSVYFEYGLSTSYGSQTTAGTKTVSGTFSATVLTNLTPGVIYDYRADLKYGSTLITGSNETVTIGSSGGGSGGSGGGTGQIYTGITVAPLATETINNDVLCIGDIVVGDGATLTINGNVHCTGNITNTTGNITINGDCTVGQTHDWSRLYLTISQLDGLTRLKKWVAAKLNSSGGISWY
jgi:hypothetical protein